MVNSPSIKPFFFGWDGFGGVPLDSLDVNPFNKNWQGVLGKLAPLGPKKIPPNIVGNQCFKSRLPQRPSEKDDITIHFFFLGQFQDRIFLFFFCSFLVYWGMPKPWFTLGKKSLLFYYPEALLTLKSTGSPVGIGTRCMNDQSLVRTFHVKEVEVGQIG